MKILIYTILLITLLKQTTVHAHQGHNEISSDNAINIASKSLKKLTFKDLGYGVGKLEKSWKSLNDSNFNVLEVLETTLIISATNSLNDQVIYFEITKNGKVLSVKHTY